MSPDVIQQLKSLKHSPKAGSVSRGKRSQARGALMMAIGHTDASVKQGTLQAWGGYYKWNVGQLVSLPATVAVSAFVLVLGGWMTTVSAAQSLPGDTLYNVKLITERAQLTLASLEHKAVLHTEFAERRLQEAAALSDDPGNEGFVSAALDAYEQQLAAAGQDLWKLQESRSAEAMAVAVTVDQRIDELNNVIDTSLTHETVKPQQEEARVATRDAGNDVVDVIVETHKSSLDPVTSHREMRSLFKGKLEDLRARETFNYGRIAMIEQVASESSNLEGVLLALAHEIEIAMDQVPEAERLVVAGGYEGAFAILKDIDATLIALESQLAEVEVGLLNAPEDADATVTEEPADEVLNEESTPDSPVTEDG